MDKFERIFALHKLLRSARRPVPLERIMEHLECSQATAYRIMREARDYLGAPIVREGAGFLYRCREGEGPWELPGLWFSASELEALLAAERVLSEVEPGLLRRDIAPLLARVRQLLARAGGGGGLTGRVRYAPMGRRPPDPDLFRRVADALARRRRLAVRYHGRARDAETERALSPQRLVYYRDNWYLDAWCHLRRALRTFSLERLREARVLERPAREVAEEVLDRYFARSYGIFAGAPRRRARLRFSAERARWVAEERWHPEQRGRFLPDGRYELEIPYGDPRELVMDVLRHGPDVEVLGPPALRRLVAERLQAAAALYQVPGQGARAAG